MIRFRQFLNEVFDKPLPYTLDEKQPNSTDYKFTTSDGKGFYRVHFTHHGDKDGTQYEILFAKTNKMGRPEVGMTNENKYQVEVMATVIKICKDFFTGRFKSGDVIHFSASNTERGKVKIYKRLAQTIAKDTGGRMEVDDFGFASEFMVFKS